LWKFHGRLEDMITFRTGGRWILSWWKRWLRTIPSCLELSLPDRTGLRLCYLSNQIGIFWGRTNRC
jgi:hypothetical protein